MFSRFFVRRPVFAWVIAILIMLAGALAIRTLPVGQYPDVAPPAVQISATYTGASAETLENSVTQVIEQQLTGLDNLLYFTSTSSSDGSVKITVTFEQGTDPDTAQVQVQNKVQQAESRLPSEVQQSGVTVEKSQSSFLLILAVYDKTNRATSSDISDWLVSNMQDPLARVEGVGSLQVFGAEYAMRIWMDPTKLASYSLMPSDVESAIEAQNVQVSAGKIGALPSSNAQQLTATVRAQSRLQTPDQFKAIIVKSQSDGSVVRLSDVARVEMGSEDYTATANLNGHPAAGIAVMMAPGANALDTAMLVKGKIAEFQRQMPQGYDIAYPKDSTEFIKISVEDVIQTLFEAIILVVCVMYLFLQNFRATLIPAVAVPVVLLGTFGVLALFGYSINTLTLFAMVLAIGLLVDDAIVDVENVFKHLRQNRKQPESERLPVLEVVFNASREVRLPILNSTFIIVVSFVPLFFLTGMEGRMLRPLGIAFITALFASTLVALTLTPVLCSFLLGSEKSDKAGKEPALVRWLQKIYNVALEWVLSHKKLTLGSVAALFAVALALFCSFGSSFLPAFNEGSFTINVSTLPGVSLEESDNVGRRAEMLLLSVPEIKTVARKTGRAELDEHALGANVSEIEAPFELSDRPKKAVVEEIRHKLGTLPGVNVEIGQPISHRIDAMLSGTRANIAIKLFGTDLNKMFEIGNQIKTKISAIPGVVDLNVEQQVERPQLQIVPKREMLAKYGVTPSEFTDMVEVYLAGRTVSRVYEGNRVFDLTVKADDDSRSTIEAIRDMPVDVVGGKVPFSQIAEIRSAAGPNTINRENVARKIVISANVSDGDLQGAVNRIRKTINDNVPLPEGYHVEYGGQFESAQSATRTLLVTSLMAILVIFLLLYGQFKNVRQASAVLLNLPLALIGGVFAIFFADGIISIPAIIGFISLFGIATRNGMLLIDRYNELRQSGLSLHDAVMRGSLDRLNPILMTALTSALALIPLALGGDLPGNEIQSPMAKVLLGGLLTSTMLNGFIVPVVYILISKKRNEQTI